MKNFSKMRQGYLRGNIEFPSDADSGRCFPYKTLFPFSGIVMDDTNEPVIGAAVMVKAPLPVSLPTLTDVTPSVFLQMMVFSVSLMWDWKDKKKVNGRTTINHHYAD